MNFRYKSQYLMVPERIHPEFDYAKCMANFLNAIYDRSAIDCQISLEDLESLLDAFKNENYFKDFQKYASDLSIHARSPNFEQQRFLAMAFPIIYDGQPPQHFEAL